eukprot:jgi/Psemu1/11172/gm1.11172_g
MEPTILVRVFGLFFQGGRPGVGLMPVADQANPDSSSSSTAFLGKRHSVLHSSVRARGFIPPWDVQVDGGNAAKTNNLNEGRNKNSGSTVTGECSKNKPNPSKESGIDTTKGNSKDTGLTDKTSKTCEKEGSNVREEKVIDLVKSPLNAVVTMPKFPVNLNGRQTTQPLEISVLLKDQDPEIMYPLYEVDEQQYENLPGYFLIFQKGKAGEHKKWCPYFKVSGLKETNPRRIKKVSDLVKCYSKEVGICDPTDGNVEVSESSSDTTKPVSEYSSTNSSRMDE